MTSQQSARKSIYTSMTKSELKAVVADYAKAFPDWELFPDGTAFTRSFGPIRQMIWFQKMSYAGYRPTHVIKTPVLSMPRMLHQVLDVKHRVVEHRWHERKFADALTAMEQQFQPSIRKPLDIAEVLALCEVAAGAMPDTTNNMTMLAILSAWLGRDGQALDYCERTQHCPLPTLAPMPEWENTMRAFGRDLAKAVGAGMAREFLEAAAQDGKTD